MNAHLLLCRRSSGLDKNTKLFQRYSSSPNFHWGPNFQPECYFDSLWDQSTSLPVYLMMPKLEKLYNNLFFEWVKANPTSEFLKGLKGTGSTQKLLSSIKHMATCYLESSCSCLHFLCYLTFFTYLGAKMVPGSVTSLCIFVFLPASFLFI